MDAGSTFALRIGAKEYRGSANKTAILRTALHRECVEHLSAVERDPCSLLTDGECREENKNQAILPQGRP